MALSRTPPQLSLVAPVDDTPGARPIDAQARDLDWSILMAHAQRGDTGAYRRLLVSLTPYVRSMTVRHHANPADVEDTVQDVLLTLHAVRHTYDPARPFGPWLVTIAQRRIVDLLRRQGRRRAREVPLEPVHETFAAAHANLSDNLTTDELRKAIDRLPPQQRDAIRLTKLGELSLDEAAAASGVSATAIKVSVHRATKTLRKLLGLTP